MRAINPEEVLHRREVENTTDLIRYAAQQIGCPKPVGNKARGKIIKAINEEMREQRWSIKHLVAAVDYMKARGIKARSVSFLLYHVQDAVKQGFLPRESLSVWDDLETSISEAVHMETDESWVRKLLSARGKALVQVYERWREERLPLLRTE